MQFSNKKILIVDKMHESIHGMLEEIGFQADYQPSLRVEEIYRRLPGYEIMFVRSKISVDERLFQAGPELKLIGRAGAGIDQIDMEAMKKRGVKLINAPEGNRDAVAEHALGMLLCLFNKLNIADAQVRRSIWDREGNRGLELCGKTVGIFGYGFMGEAFAQRLRGFNCRVLAYDKYRRGFGNEYVEECSLEDLWEKTDVLSLHVPLTGETRNLIGLDFLQRFKKNIFLLNTARGELVPLKALHFALQKGKVLGAALDVMENEKLHFLLPEQEESFHYLVNNDRVLFSPHVAGWTQESYVKINKTLVEKLKTLSM